MQNSRPSGDPSGAKTWTKSGYKLGQIPNSAPGYVEWGAWRVAPWDDIPAGSTTIFSFPITAPSTPNTYNLQWQMIDLIAPAWLPNDGGIGGSDSLAEATTPI